MENSEGIRPLAAAEWFDALHHLDLRLAGEEGGAERALRHALHLVQLAPPPMAELLPPALCEGSFERCLEHGALETAAFRLLGGEMDFELCRQAGTFGARIWLPGHADTPRAQAATAAAALLRAWCGCLLSLNARTAAAAPVRSPGDILRP